MRTLSGGIVLVAAVAATALAGPALAKPVPLVLPDGHASVCAPSQGAVLVVNDPFPASR